MTHDCDIAIIGAGAAGLTAGIFAGEAALAVERPRPLRIVILDGAKTIGAKILVAGGGRCNVTNVQIRPADYNGSKNIVKNVLAAFDERRAVDWFASLGVELKREPTGKLFPITDKARTVLDALLNRCRALNVEVVPDERVHDIKRIDGEPGGFEIVTQKGVWLAGRVIMATGGRSLPRTGSDGAGWAILKRMGHTVTSTHMALVSLVCDGAFFHGQLSGLSHEATLRTFVDGKQSDERTGSLLWTHFGISGPLAMDASRHFTTAQDVGQTVQMRLNFLPEYNAQSLDAWLVRQSAARPRSNVSATLSDLLPTRVVEVLLQHTNVNPATSLSQLPKDARRSIVAAFTDLLLPVTQARGWNHAEVTAGGVPLNEIDYRTMASRRVPGLHLVGELLDVDGRIGGFNFQWAWATGYLAGRAAIGE